METLGLAIGHSSMRQHMLHVATDVIVGDLQWGKVSATKDDVTSWGKIPRWGTSLERSVCEHEFELPLNGITLSSNSAIQMWAFQRDLSGSSMML